MSNGHDGKTAVTIRFTPIRVVCQNNAAERAGIVAYTAYRLRNSILHVNEEGLDIYKKRDLGVRMAGWAFVACRLVKHAEENKIASIN
jgi:hypothetical protein